ncbi:MAG: terminase family protein [Pseudomonadota bacterium]
MKSLTPQAKAALNWKWRGWWARQQQLAPDGAWRQWGYVAGRGAGKTRGGAEWVREQIQAGRRNLALIAPTAADARDVMVEGPSGILRVCWQHDVDLNGDVTGLPTYEPSKRRLTWQNGAQALLFSAEEAERLRGPQFDGAWADELAAWKKGIDVWDMLMFALRLGDDPRAIFTTTPRVTPLIRRLMKDPGTVLTRGSTFDNRANLAAPAIAALKDLYEGTRLGRQELYGELLEDVPGALWTGEMLEKARLKDMQEAQRIVVAVDPSGADGDPEGGSDDIGIVVAAKFYDGTFGVLEDATCNLSPAGWGRRAVERYGHHLADCIVAEKNFGGAMVEAVIKNADRNAKVVMVTASRGKAVRAEPIAALYEQGRVAHAPGLEKLEEQMTHMTLTGYVGDGSPDRLDAAVWALTELTEGTDYNLSSWAAA